MKRLAPMFFVLLPLVVVLPVQALPRSPLPPWPERVLNSWRFDSEASWGGPLSPPWALQGVQVLEGWSGYSMRIGGTVPGVARFPGFQTDGRPNLTLNEGTVRLWVAPDWSSASLGGSGPGSFARLIEVGEASVKGDAWWALYLNPAGDTLHFSAQAGGASADYLKVSIAWRAGEWHQVALVYSEKGSALYVDGALAAEGEGVSVVPEPTALAASGFCVGGDAGGTALAFAQFDELTTFGHACSAEEIAANYRMSAGQAALGPVSVAEVEARRASGALLKANLPDSELGGEGTMMFLGGPAAPVSPCGTNLCLAIEVVDEYAVLTLWNTQPGTNYQIFSRTNVFSGAFTNPALGASAVLEQELVGVDGRDWTQTVIPMTGRSNLFFWARSTPSAEPHLHITSTNCPVLPQPYVQIRGYSETPLAGLSYTVLNASGGTNGQGFVTQQAYDVVAGKLTTNWWQCFDVELAPGMNRVLIQAVDRLGVSNFTTLHFAQLYLADRDAPQPALGFPPVGVMVSGTNFTLRGVLDNPTATVIVQSTNGGATRSFGGVMERDGTFWVENIPLPSGENGFSVIVVDPGGSASTNQIVVEGTASSFVITPPLSSPDLYQPTVSISGTVDEGGYAVMVNGVAATVVGTSWSVSGVPINRGGVAVFTAVASLTNGPMLVAEVAVEKPTRAFLNNVDRLRAHSADWTPCDFGSNATISTLHLSAELHWGRFEGGAGSEFSLAQFRCENGQVVQSTNAFSEWWDSAGLYTNSAGQPNCVTCLPEPYAEQCTVETTRDVMTTVSGLKQSQFSFHSQSQMHVQTGGRSVARQNALTRFTGAGTEYLVRDDPQNVSPFGPALWNWDFAWATSSPTNYVTNLPPATITVLGGALDAQGHRYISLPAGAELDCTPFAGGEYVHFTISAEDATPTLITGAGNGTGLPEKLLHLIDPSVENPGKVLFASTGDTDGDGVPDLADGFGLFGAEPTNGAARSFAPITIRIPTTLDTNRARFQLSYELSTPGGVSMSGNVDDGFTYTPAGGQLRLWTQDGPAARTNAFLQDGGHVVSPTASYALHELPFLGTASDPYYQVILYVESVRASTEIGDQKLKLIVEPDGVDSGLLGVRTDEVHFTSLDAVLVAVDSGGNTTPTTKLEVSHPSPIVTLSACSVSNVRASTDYQRILGDLNLAGVIQSAVCDFTPGADGTIDEVFVYVNSYDEPVAVVPASSTKTLDESSFLRPFPFTGAFSTNLAGVELEMGLNLIRVTAVDKVYGITGYTEYTVEVTGQKTNELLQSYADAGVGLDFGSLASLSQLDGSTPVTLYFTNKATSATYSGALFKVSDAPLVLSNALAWVDIPDSSALDIALGSSGAGRFDTSVSVPALAPLHIGFTLERPTNSGPFTFQFVEMQLTANGPLDGTTPDTVTAQVRKGGSAWQSATLTNSANATNTFSNTGGSFTVTLSYSPSLVATQVDEVIVEVINTALAMDGLTFGLLETNASSKVFLSDPGLLYLDDDWRDWTFGSGTAAPLAASTGGEFKPYALQFLGPSDLLNAVTNLAVLDAFGQPAGSRQIVRKGNKHLLRALFENYAIPTFLMNIPGAGLASQVLQGDLTTPSDLTQFQRGFTVGFFQGGVGLVESVATLATIGFKLSPMGYLYETHTGQNYKHEKDMLVTTYLALEPLLNFVLDIKALQVNAALSAVEGDFDQAVSSLSESMAMQVNFVKEVIVYLEQFDATNTAYNRGRLSGRVMFEVVTLAIAEVKLAQAVQAARITKVQFLQKLLAQPGVQAEARAKAAVESAITAVSRPVASFGQAASTNYREIFFTAFPELRGRVVVHHAVEQQVLTRYPGVVSVQEIHSLQNLRGIPIHLNPDLHLSQIRKAWNAFYRETPTPTKQQLLDKATEIDRRFGHLFTPGFNSSP